MKGEREGGWESPRLAAEGRVLAHTDLACLLRHRTESPLDTFPLGELTEDLTKGVPSRFQVPTSQNFERRVGHPRSTSEGGV